jgi:hypothetical protein
MMFITNSFCIDFESKNPKFLLNWIASKVLKCWDGFEM